MEDALVLGVKHWESFRISVLILVLMEDALVHDVLDVDDGLLWVLILVLMEDALVLLKTEMHKLGFYKVLILVLMEDALVLDDFSEDMSGTIES